MNKLQIDTRFPDAVEALLLSEELIESGTASRPGNCFLEIAYPDDGLSQSLTYWLVMAQGCKLVDRYTFEWRGYK